MSYACYRRPDQGVFGYDGHDDEVPVQRQNKRQKPSVAKGEETKEKDETIEQSKSNSGEQDAEVAKLKSDLKEARRGWRTAYKKWKAGRDECQSEKDLLNKIIQELESAANENTTSPTDKGDASGKKPAAEYEKLAEENKALRAAWRRTTSQLTTLMSLQPRFEGSQDDVLIAKFKELRGAIRIFSSSENNFKLSSHGNNLLPEDQDEDFKTLTPYWNEYITTPGLREYLFGAYIWRLLSVNIFRKPNVAFGTVYCDILDTFYHAFDNAVSNGKLSLKMQASWKSLIPNMIIQSSAIDNNSIATDLALIISQSLLLLLPHMQGRKEHEVLLNNMHRFVELSVEIAQLFALSIPSYTVHVGDTEGPIVPGSEPDPRYIDGTFEPTSLIRLVTTPCLTRHGDKTATNFDQEVVLVKAEAVFDGDEFDV